MNKTISAEFDSAYLADRACGRIKSYGIAAIGTKTIRKQAVVEPGLFISHPYPWQQHSYNNNLSFGLPQTTGTSIIMDTAVFDQFGDGGGSDSVRLEMTVDEQDMKSVKSILINSGARSIKINS